MIKIYMQNQNKVLQRCDKNLCAKLKQSVAKICTGTVNTQNSQSTCKENARQHYNRSNSKHTKKKYCNYRLDSK